MSEYRILLVEELVLSDSAEFIVNAETPGDAASQLIRARHDGLDQDSDIVRLPDGQTAEIKPQDVARSRLFCVLLAAAGNQIGEIKPAHSTAAAPCGPQPLLTDAAEDRREPHWLYDANDWEFTYSRRELRQLLKAANLSVNEIREFATLIKEPPIYAVRIPVAFDEDGWPNETEIRWRRDKRDANAALTLAWGKSPNPEYAPPRHSPWGAIDAIRFIAPGIFEVSTPGHGGIHLSPTLNADMPDDMRSSDAWYEEDVKWSLVALKYPAPFKAMTEVDPGDRTKTAYDLALQCARSWYPDIVARHLLDDTTGAPVREEARDPPRA